MSDTPPVIVRRRIDSLSHDPANVRIHGDKNIAAIKASLLRFGQQKPVVIDRNGVVHAGNGTLAAARALGWAELDCIETNLEGSEAVAYAIADNRTAELAEWDDSVLVAVLQSLEHEDKALLEAAGFSEAELMRLVSRNDEEYQRVSIGEICYRVIVFVQDEHKQAEFMARMEAEGYKCQPLMS